MIEPRSDSIEKSFLDFFSCVPFGIENFLENHYVPKKSPRIEPAELTTDKVLSPHSCPRELPCGSYDRISSILLRVIARQSQRTTLQAEVSIGPILSATEKSIMATVEALGSASPAMIGSALSISRATGFRGLSRLAKEGLLRQEGATRRSRYCSVPNKKT